MDQKRPIWKHLIPGYETTLNPSGVHDIGKTYRFAVITAAQCDEIIALGCESVRKVEQKPAKKGGTVQAPEVGSETL